MTDDPNDKAKRIAASRAALAARYAADPDAVTRFEARKARLTAAAKRERERFDLLVLGHDRPPPLRSVTRQRGKRRVVKTPVMLDAEIEAAVSRREQACGGQGTPETQSKAHRGALAQLHVNGVIDREQLEWADEIASAADAILADVKVGVASLEARVDESKLFGGKVLESLRAARRAVAYNHWLTLIPRPQDAVLDMLTRDQIGYTLAARRYRMDHRKAKGLLLRALNLWPSCADYAARFVTREALTAAHEDLA